MELTASHWSRRFVLTFTTNSSQQRNLIFRKNPRLENLALKNATLPPPKGGYHVRKIFVEWKTYRTRFLVRAQQLDRALAFTDALGREHRGRIGDYLVESSDGTRSITPRAIFEDIYVAMGMAELPSVEKMPTGRKLPVSSLKRRSLSKVPGTISKIASA
jgi:hypothetical protein